MDRDRLDIYKAKDSRFRIAVRKWSFTEEPVILLNNPIDLQGTEKVRTVLCWYLLFCAALIGGVTASSAQSLLQGATIRSI